MEDTRSASGAESEDKSDDVTHDKLDTLAQRAPSINIKMGEFPENEMHELVAKVNEFNLNDMVATLAKPLDILNYSDIVKKVT